MFKGMAWQLVAFGETKSVLQSQELTWPPADRRPGTGESAGQRSVAA
jgi:hypothetical protein